MGRGNKETSKRFPLSLLQLRKNITLETSSHLLFQHFHSQFSCVTKREFLLTISIQYQATSDENKEKY